MDTDHTISTAAAFAKAVIYQILVLSQALHHEFPLLYDAIRYLVAAYVCYRITLFAARSLYTTALWIIRMMVIAYIVYIAVCVLSTVDASMSSSTTSSNPADFDLDVLVDAVVTTAVRETHRLYAVARVATAGAVLACRRLQLVAQARDLVAGLVN